jgi:hypothetical protein
MYALSPQTHGPSTVNNAVGPRVGSAPRLPFPTVASLPHITYNELGLRFPHDGKHLFDLNILKP